MVEILFSVAIAFLFGISIFGYICTFVALQTPFFNSGIFVWVKKIALLFLYIFGAGSIFIAPAYVYGRFKFYISDVSFFVFIFSFSLVSVLFFFIVRIWISILSNISWRSEGKG